MHTILDKLQTLFSSYLYVRVKPILNNYVLEEVSKIEII